MKLLDNEILIQELRNKHQMNQTLSLNNSTISNIEPKTRKSIKFIKDSNEIMLMQNEKSKKMLQMLIVTKSRLEREIKESIQHLAKINTTAGGKRKTKKQIRKRKNKTMKKI